MATNNYFMIITNTDNKLSGSLQETQGNKAVIRQAEFDPLVVLWDLLCTVEKVDNPKANQRDIPDFLLKKDCIEHPFYLGQEYINSSRALPNFRVKPYFLILDELNEIIVNNKHLTLNEFEILKQFFKLEFTYKMEIEKPNPEYFELRDVNKPKYLYLPLEYSYNYDIKHVFSDNNEMTHRFIYTCYSIADIVFSVLHYLMLFDYKFNQCEHCGKYIANTSFKKYCNRKSPYKGYEHLECWEAVDHVIKKIEKRKNSIKTNLYKYYAKIASGFLDEYAEHKKNEKSVENLEMLEYITSPEYVKNKWYREEYKKK